MNASYVEKACLIAGLVLTTWYAWIIDDAYVYFRYADNFVIHDIGLVYNQGEYVEGYSSPAWMLLMTVLRLLGLNYWHIILVLGLLSYTVFWYLCVKTCRGLSPPIDGRLAINLPLVYLTFTYGVICYFTSGTASPLVLLIAAAYAAFYLSPGCVWIQVLVGLSPIVRHELALPFVIAFAWLWISRRRFPSLLVVVCGASVGAYEIFRIWYFADLLPNTFYLKDSVWITQGLLYLYDAFLPYNTLPFLGIMAVVYVASRPRHGPSTLLERERLMMVASGLSILLYVVRIGGDPRHFRYLVFPFTLLVLSTGGLVEKALGALLEKYHQHIVVLTACLALVFFSGYPRQLTQHPIFRTMGYNHVQVFKINDASLHKYRRPYTPSSFVAQKLSDEAARERYRSPYKTFGDSQCYKAYMNPNAYVVQTLGLTEPILARTRMKATRPAHKTGLTPLAHDILELREKYGQRRGAFSDAVRDGGAPRWVADNIESIEIIEKKVYNVHSLSENIGLAFTSVPRLEP